MDEKSSKRAERDEMIEQINANLSAKPVQMAMAVICILLFIGFLYFGFLAN